MDPDMDADPDPQHWYIRNPDPDQGGQNDDRQSSNQLSVADPGCLSRIRAVFIPFPGGLGIGKYKF